MNIHVGQLTLELTVGFVALFVLTKILGKTQISQITPFDFVSSIFLGELVGNAMYDDDTSIFVILYAITIWGSLVYIVEYITQKYKGTRKLLEGAPTIVIRKGYLDRRQLKKCKLDINQLQNLVRQKGYFSLREVEYAILETNGSLSIMPKYQYGSPNRQDLNMHTDQQPGLPVTLILDGEINMDNLSTAGISKKELINKVHEHGYKTVKEVLYAELSEGELLFMPMTDPKKP
ncbi:DUF421 domain-containing protein [Fictibacillus phosphorivorans]|uniref:DUF421 domain-containing protein n=1 Tax=Fictibacillus phosphorivorans TaxID=1221500 RepID=UPI00203E265E|nr:DUF421 domain-containing protein [Fictibacillus phosphorivorans]MCM3719158.1 DUF421 domain-containing protein [Fictibacillus phosphorivorans]MCM3776780.1 DUF421 domain-containing protein [Fictibacillus phosphorivorans]